VERLFTRPGNAGLSSAPLTPLIRSAAFAALKSAILALAPADLAYLRRWFLRYVNEAGNLDKTATPPRRRIAGR